jgi:hypothetical protein
MSGKPQTLSWRTRESRNCEDETVRGITESVRSSGGRGKSSSSPVKGKFGGSHISHQRDDAAGSGRAREGVGSVAGGQESERRAAAGKRTDIRRTPPTPRCGSSSKADVRESSTP